jgi:hypothetical protein
MTSCIRPPISTGAVGALGAVGEGEDGADGEAAFAAAAGAEEPSPVVALTDPTAGTSGFVGGAAIVA